MTDLHVSKRIELVLAAIERVKFARGRWLQAEQSPASDSNDIALAKDQYHVCEREFGWQWENVQAIIKHFGESHD